VGAACGKAACAETNFSGGVAPDFLACFTQKSCQMQKQLIAIKDYSFSSPPH
jgi:hypothetical protein